MKAPSFKFSNLDEEKTWFQLEPWCSELAIPYTKEEARERKKRKKASEAERKKAERAWWIMLCTSSVTL